MTISLYFTVLFLIATVSASELPVCSDKFLLDRSISGTRQPCRVTIQTHNIYDLFASYQGILLQLLPTVKTRELPTQNEEEIQKILALNQSDIDNLFEADENAITTYSFNFFPKIDIFPAHKISCKIYKDGEIVFDGPILDIPTFQDSDSSWTFLFHGMGDTSQLDDIVARYLKNKGYLVIPDYSIGTKPLLYYPLSLYGLESLIKLLHVDMWNILKPNPSKTVFIGHSFGGHVAGVLGKEVLPERVIVLDPAGPLFDQLNIPTFDHYSGKRSISFHTSRPWGSVKSLATTDIYVNDRRNLYHECGHDHTMMCNHQSSMIVFLECIDNEFLLYQDHKEYSVLLEETYTISSGIFNTQSRLKQDKNTRNPILVKGRDISKEEL